MTAISLQDLVIQVASQLRDCVTGTVTTGGTATFRDSARAAERDDRFNGSECFFRAPNYLGGGTPPFTVTDFAQAGGVFTLNAGGAINVGDQYALVNVAGRGYPYADILRALALGMEQLKPATIATDEAALPYVDGTFSYTIPGAYTVLEGVYLLRTIGGRSYRIPLKRSRVQGFDVLPGTRTLLLYGTPESGDIIGFTGEQRLELPLVLNATVDLDSEALVNAAIENLTRGGDQREQAIAAGQYLDRLRTQPVYRRPNSIALP